MKQFDGFVIRIHGKYVSAILANIKEPFVVACFDIIKVKKKMREALQE